MRTQAIGGERYFMLCIDEYSRMTWIHFLKHKSESLDAFKTFKNLAENMCGRRIKCLRTYQGKEFTWSVFQDYCYSHGIKIQHLAARTPQQNGVVERKNRTVVEMARTMMAEHNISHRFWKEATYSAVHILNRFMLRPGEDMTPYEMWFGRRATAKYLRVFGSKCFIKNKDQGLGKFDDRADEGIFLGYSSQSKAYKCYNKRLGKVVESYDVQIDEREKSIITKSSHYPSHEDCFDDDNEEDEPVANHDEDLEESRKTLQSRFKREHPIKQVIGDPQAGVHVRKYVLNPIV